ncbi:patatin-like phospholipase family protein [Photobacterium gaetbulicola]|uniref:Putative patatin n=1 Tax=Photobacterium gaetbulicola Gung47 TaxID=658445 RepID=A0A0C5WZF0_9GAMM|nr:patatin-like phospholipase family protein [Photobacterium gaetbulicola]AJR08430.1 putative patatin [Photobacterium gaetbulicola Gung47]PSU12063.1 patatin-like phospholipase family protein [Photobacterium gaetbulicola]
MNKEIIAFLLSAFLIGCTSDLQRNPAPAHLNMDYGLFNSKTLRHWGDTPFSIEQYVFDEKLRSNTFDKNIIVDEAGNFRAQHYLTISGGGANGAYGAGLLNGLSASGKRPEYRMVTGISTGAIIGLYAFLGEEYDHKLRDFYTQLSDQDLYQTRYVWEIFSSSSLLNTARFEKLVREEIDRDLLDKVKEEYLRGRTFLVKTTNLDAQRPVIWNMGEIAMHDTKEAERLFQSVIIASASIPGIFEPVLIPMHINGVQYDELHVDGGVIAQAFFIPENMDVEEFASIEDRYFTKLGIDLPEERESHIWMINNSRIGAIWEPTQPSLTNITGRSISTMIKYQGRSNLTNIYQQSQLIGASFNFSYIDHRIPDAPSEAPFSKQYMQYMYCYGYAQGLSDNHWKSDLPNYSQFQSIESWNNSFSDIEYFNWERIEPGLTGKINECLLRLNEI